MEAITKRGKKIRGKIAEILVRKGRATEVKEEKPASPKKAPAKKKAATKKKAPAKKTTKK